MMNIMQTVKLESGNGVIIWGSSSQFKTASQCQAFKSFLENDLKRVIQDSTKLKQFSKK